MGATNTLDRLASSIGKLGPVDPKFSSCLDIPNGGVLFGLPALLTVGLLRHSDRYFTLPQGYYGLYSIFLLLAFMALARQKFAENLRYIAPGEWGKLLGLDRAPEVKILREKVALLTQDDIPKQWNATLCKDWMNEAPEGAFTLYIDGHVRVYHGKMTKLPRHYISRDKLCARATIDYWVNSIAGQPLFLVTKPVDPGLLNTLELDIIPRLKEDIPNQPTEEELKANPLLHRFCLVFDREGYSPDRMIKMQKDRIAVITYNKNIGEDWPLEEFKDSQIKLQSGEIVNYKMAERGVFKKIRKLRVKERKELFGDSYKSKKGIWVREIRKLKDNGQQGSIIATDYINDLGIISYKIFARWSQENFFAYMMKHFALDRVIDYKLEKVSDTVKVINPEYRKLESEIRSLNSQLTKNKAKFAGLSLDVDIGTEKFDEKQKQKAELLEEINRVQDKIIINKSHKKTLKKHILVNELPEDLKFEALNSKSKHFIDTIKMIAYRAETATVNILKETMSPYAKDEARSLMRAIFETSADLIVDEKNQTLTVRLHNLANHCSNKVVSHLCEELNSLEIDYPRTTLRMVYKLISEDSPEYDLNGGAEIEKEVISKEEVKEQAVEKHIQEQLDGDKQQENLGAIQLSFWD